MLLSLALFTLVSTHQPQDKLEQGFRNPPPSARPHTWWHWMDGNVTKEGITADLEAMAQVGIGGAQMFTVAQGIPKGPVDYISPLWREMTKHAIQEAGRLGIELCLHNCAGWSSSGGPWVTPENAMQVIAWSEKNVSGPRKFEEQLPPPKAPQVYAEVSYYKEIAVFAFRTQPKPDQSKDFLGRTGVIRQDGLHQETTVNATLQDMVVLTEKLDKNGKLIWNVPAGDWTILRMGHVPTGKNNHPAPPEGDGLEVDKLSKEALDAFWKGTMATVIKDAGPLAGKVLNNALVDSYEVGSQNWTPKMREEFIKRRGYDPMPYLPTITGLTVGDSEKTERFLWDWRRTIADLYADNYYGYFGELCHKAGLQFSTEPYGNGGFDNIQAGGKSDIPMGEFWIGGGTLETTKIASSTGHVYGLPVIGAESFTADEGRGKWLEEPYTAKALGDLVFTNGVNRYIFHRYAHQPWMDKSPGMTMGPWGTHLERTQTWWTEAGEWLKYVARCQYLLQRGKFVADALYFYGEGAPVDLPYRPNLKPSMPAGFDYDGCDASVVMERLKVKNGRLVLPDGMSYRVLVLPDSKTMTPAMATKIFELVQAGATVVGPKPSHSPSLVQYPSSDIKVAQIATKLWGTVDDKSLKERRVGKGRIVWNKPLADVFMAMKVGPDFSFSSKSGGSKLVYIHREIDGDQVYFVSNQQYRPTQVDCSFRVTGLAPELWHADSGKIENAPVYRIEGDRTVVPLRFDPAESVFVVFRKPLKGDYLTNFGLMGEKTQEIKTPKIEIVSAHYGTEDGRGSDVREVIRQMIKEGQYEIAASNGLFGDPVVNVVKRLKIGYKRDGKLITASVPENDTISLIDLPNTPILPAAFTLDTKKNEIWLTPWVKGSYVGKTKKGRTLTTDVRVSPDQLKISGSWNLKFPPNWGAPTEIKLDSLISWSNSKISGVRYFSGSAVYYKDINIPSTMLLGDRTTVLDLGRVKHFATVRLNGKELAVLWKEPFTVDITKSIKTGKNKLEIKVTNLWPNRIIGDEQLPPDVEWNGAQLKEWPEWLAKGQPRPKTGRYTFTTWRYWNKDSDLLESGLIGLVVIRSAKNIKIKL